MRALGRLVDRRLTAKQRNPNADVSALEREIDSSLIAEPESKVAGTTRGAEMFVA